jgi:hypothetical protein
VRDTSARLYRLVPSPVDRYSSMQLCSLVAGGTDGVGGAFGGGGDGGGVEGEYKGGGADGGKPRHRRVGLHTVTPSALRPISQLCNFGISFPTSSRMV